MGLGLKRSSLGIMAIFAITVIGLMGFPNAHADYDYLSQFGSFGTSNSQFDSPNGVAVDSSGNIYVADYTNDRVQKFDSSGAFHGWIGNCSSGTNCDTIHQVTTSFCNDCTVLGSAGTGNGQFNHPDGIAFDSFGNIYVTDRSNARVEAFTSSGAFHGWIGNCSDSADSGNCDTINQVTTSFCDDCTVLGSAGQISDTTSIAIDSSNNIYVTDTFNNRVLKFNFAGAYQSQFGSAGTGNGQFDLPHDVAIDSTGNIYVADTNNNRVQEFNSAGVYQSQFGTPGSGNGQFNGPVGIAFDSFGNIYVAEQGNNRVQEFNSAGVYQSQFGSAGTGNGQFSGPTYLAFDSFDDVYVADNGNNRVQNFGPLTTIITPTDGETVTTAFPIISGNTYAGYDHVKVYEDTCGDGCDVLLGSTTAVNGAWTFTPISPLTNGNHAIFAKGVLTGVEQDRSLYVHITVAAPTIPPIQAMYIGNMGHLSHGLAFVGSHLYSISSADNNIRETDPTTGATISSIPITITGHTVTQGNGLAVNPIDQKLYAILQLQGVPNRELVTLNPTTGVATDIGNTGDKFAGLAFGADGTLYGVTGFGATVHDTIFTINTGNALTTSFVALPSSTGGESIAFSPDDGFLYNSQGNPAHFNKIDLGTKSITPISISGTPLIGEEPTALTFDSATGSFLWATLNNNLFNVGGNKILYGIAHLGPSGLNTLYTINPTTGAATTVGPITGFDQCGAMDFNAAETLFATCVRHSDSIPILVTINTATGAATVVGSGTSLGSSISDISFRNIDGKLFAYTISEGNSLDTIDTSTGVGAFVGSAGVGIGNGMAFSPSNVLYKVDSSLNTLDQSSGSPTTIASLTFPLGLTNPRINAMDTQPSTGIMFASLNDNPSNYLATVDTTTGVVTKIGSTVAGLDAIAFGPAISTSPTISLSVDNTSPKWGVDPVSASGTATGFTGTDSIIIKWGDGFHTIIPAAASWAVPHTYAMGTVGAHTVNATLVDSTLLVVKAGPTANIGVNVQKHPTRVDVPAPSNVDFGSVKWGFTFPANATLIDTTLGSYIQGRTIGLSGTGLSGPFTTPATGANGFAQVTAKASGIGSVGAQTVVATFTNSGPHDDYLDSTNSTGITILPHATSLNLNLPPDIPNGTKLTISGNLMDADYAGAGLTEQQALSTPANPLGQPITFDGSGVATALVPPPAVKTGGITFSNDASLNIVTCGEPTCTRNPGSLLTSVNILQIHQNGIITLPKNSPFVSLSFQGMGSGTVDISFLITKGDGTTSSSSVTLGGTDVPTSTFNGLGNGGIASIQITSVSVPFVGISAINAYDSDSSPSTLLLATFDSYAPTTYATGLTVFPGTYSSIETVSKIYPNPGLQVQAHYAGDPTSYLPSTSPVNSFSTLLNLAAFGTGNGGEASISPASFAGISYTSYDCSASDKSTAHDAICDSWKTTGIPYKVNGAQFLYTLPGGPLLTTTKYIFTEIDAMTGHSPNVNSLTAVKNQFAANGITLINQEDQDGNTGHNAALPHIPNMAVWTDFDNNPTNDFSTIRAYNFGTPSEHPVVNGASQLDGQSGITGSSPTPGLGGNLQTTVSGVTLSSPQNSYIPMQGYVVIRQFVTLNQADTLQAGTIATPAVTTVTGGTVTWQAPSAVVSTTTTTNKDLITITVPFYTTNGAQLSNTAVPSLTIPVTGTKTGTTLTMGTPFIAPLVSTTLLDAKALAFHYALWAHSFGSNCGPSGLAVPSGTNVIVSLGCNFNTAETGYTDPNGNTATVGDQNQQAGTYMHELGHNLGLNHGGPLYLAIPNSFGPSQANFQTTAVTDSQVNCKPAYESIMSYSRQLPNLLTTNWRLDYSQGDFAASPASPTSIAESNLNEPAGLVSKNSDIPVLIYGINSGGTVKPITPTAQGSSATSIDWSGDGYTERISSTQVNAFTSSPTTAGPNIVTTISGVTGINSGVSGTIILVQTVPLSAKIQVASASASVGAGTTAGLTTGTPTVTFGTAGTAPTNQITLTINIPYTAASPLTGASLGLVTTTVTFKTTGLVAGAVATSYVTSNPTTSSTLSPSIAQGQISNINVPGCNTGALGKIQSDYRDWDNLLFDFRTGYLGTQTSFHGEESDQNGKINKQFQNIANTFPGVTEHLSRTGVNLAKGTNVFYAGSTIESEFMLNDAVTGKFDSTQKVTFVAEKISNSCTLPPIFLTPQPLIVGSTLFRVETDEKHYEYNWKSPSGTSAKGLYAFSFYENYKSAVPTKPQILLADFVYSGNFKLPNNYPTGQYTVNICLK